MSVETALSYAALILVDSDVEVSPEKLLSLTQKANVEVEGIWADIYAKALDGQNVKDLLFNISSGPAAAASSGAAAGAAATEEKAEEKEEEPKEESDEDMGFGLFD